jgi:hypothetical protein
MRSAYQIRDGRRAPRCLAVRPLFGPLEGNVTRDPCAAFTDVFDPRWTTLSGSRALPANLCPFSCSGESDHQRRADDSLVAPRRTECKGAPRTLPDCSDQASFAEVSQVSFERKKNIALSRGPTGTSLSTLAGYFTPLVQSWCRILPASCGTVRPKAAALQSIRPSMWCA